MDEKIDIDNDEQFNRIPDFLKIPASTGGFLRDIEIDEKISDSHFNENEYFIREIKPLLEAMLDKCSRQNIPFLCCINPIHEKGKGSGIYTAAVLPGMRTPAKIRFAADLFKDKAGEVIDEIIEALTLKRFFDLANEFKKGDVDHE